MTVFKPSLPPYKVTITKIGVPEGSGRLIAASAISSRVKKLAAAPTATAPVVSLRNLRLEIVSMAGS
jgi:hypothetical protein